MEISPTHHTVPTSEDQSRAQRLRNRNTIRITRVNNGYIVTPGDTNEPRIYHDLGFMESGDSDQLETVFGFTAEFFGNGK